MLIRNQYITALANKGQREDGRKLDEFRQTRIEANPIANAEGSARVWIGKTDVIVGVKLGVGEPYSDKPDEGVLVSNAELSPMAHPDFEPGPPGEKAIELARVVDRGIRESHAIDIRKLCIKEREKVWMVNVDTQVMNHDGNLIDASSLAAIVALRNAKMLHYDEKTEKVDIEKRTGPLPLLDIPVAVTIYKIGGRLVLDPTYNEEEAATARLTVSTTGDGQIAALQKGGTEPLSLDEIRECFRLSVEKGREIRKLI
ncbi:MAG: exosome complex protein Rrp42 [Candidatus Aenigmarchaeota archaeon]|nr:exosome complex protein Rrp42 [Candidatus Aenigmarchaeota archaeon]